MDGLNQNLALARNVAASRASRQYHCLHNHAVLSLLWHAAVLLLLCRICGMLISRLEISQRYDSNDQIVLHK